MTGLLDGEGSLWGLVGWRRRLYISLGVEGLVAVACSDGVGGGTRGLEQRGSLALWVEEGAGFFCFHFLGGGDIEEMVKGGWR